jgi:8-oxo-dGTP pyrophosphatase MutT (NUDIX family)
MHDKHKMWLAPGGHIELDEDPVEAAYREVAEEVGIPIVIYQDKRTFTDTDSHDHELVVPQFVNRHAINDTHEHISFVYFATSETRETSPQKGETTDGFKWFTKVELLDPIYSVSERIQMYAKKAIDTLS